FLINRADLKIPAYKFMSYFQFFRDGRIFDDRSVCFHKKSYASKTEWLLDEFEKIQPSDLQKKLLMFKASNTMLVDIATPLRSFLSQPQAHFALFGGE